MKLPTASAQAARHRWRLQVTGVVQGVGFRPFVYHLAMRLELSGWVANTPGGVIIEAEGHAAQLARLRVALQRRPPPAARVQAVTVEDVAVMGERDFEVRESLDAGPGAAHLPADLATCDACLAELFDPASRRYRYPFLNCTDCGPRFSIIEGLPYDRERTTMCHFSLCEHCRREYGDPADRRFHAEPNACPVCGPQLALWDADGHQRAAGEEALGQGVELLRAGGIVAVKSLGGFQLLADACNAGAVRRLRLRKARPDKPLAVMFPTLADVESACHITALERQRLASPARPIVLLRAKAASVTGAVAPGCPWLGVMLPFTPLHHLLLDELKRPVVATSGNRAGEPIVTDEREAVGLLGAVADAFLVHDRAIARPVDDSVVRVVAGRELVLRRARGYSPSLGGIAGLSDGLLALGGHLKNTLAFTVAGQVVLSQHLGDLESPRARAVYRRALSDLPRLHGVAPRVLAGDCHPDYYSTQVAQSLALPSVSVPHHLAHVAACMAEHGLDAPVLGVAWDGSGHGDDGTVWGGEFLHIDRCGYRRVAHLRPFSLPGGEAALREPRRCAWGLLTALFDTGVLAMTDLDCVAAFTQAEREVLLRSIRRGVNSPLTSSVGRLFDAVAALLGVRQRTSYEGQAAVELEWLAGASTAERVYNFPVDRSDADKPWVLDWAPVLGALLRDRAAGVPAAEMAAAFHRGLAGAIVAVAERVGESRVALGGGCFQNAWLTEVAVSRLQQAGFEPWWPSQVPPNDGGLALGQLKLAGRALPCV